MNGRVLTILNEFSQSEETDFSSFRDLVDHIFQAGNGSTLEFILSFVLKALREEVHKSFVFLGVLSHESAD